MALWWVNDDLLQEGLCHIQVYCTQSPFPRSSPLMTRTSSGDTQIQFCLRLKLKKIGKTTRPFRYEINQISHDYTVEVRNKFKGLDLVDRVPEEQWTEVHDIVQEARIKTIPKKKKCKKLKCLSEEALQIAMKRKNRKAKEKRKDIPI